MTLFRRWMGRVTAAYQHELLKAHYDEVENMYRQMRFWRHDYRNHIQTMKSYAQTGDFAALRQYLDELDRELAHLEPAVKTGNAMADAILNSKISLARARDIPVTAQADIPVALSMSPLDLCAVLGNLFDNAIEANLLLPPQNRMIRLYMDMKNTQLYICFTNFAPGGKLRKIGGRFVSAKGAGHGFGLMRVEQIVAHLGGYISLNSEDGAFTAEILLPQ
jgi:two-component system sensor histidine kinase AgrC